MDKRDLADDVTTKNSSDRRQPLKTTVSMPILGHRTAASNDENRRERRPLVGKTDEVSAPPDDQLPRPALTKSTSCYCNVQQTSSSQPSSDSKPSRADDQ